MIGDANRYESLACVGDGDALVEDALFALTHPALGGVVHLLHWMILDLDARIDAARAFELLSGS